MYGANSPSFMADTAQELAETLPNAELIPLDGQTHDVKADVIAPVLDNFYKN